MISKSKGDSVSKCGKSVFVVKSDIKAGPPLIVKRAN